MLVKRWLVRKCYYLQRFRHLFFKEAPLGRPKVWYCRQTHFFQKQFYFLPKMSLTTVTHFGPLDPPPGGNFMSKSFVLLKEFDGFSWTHQFYLRFFILFGLGWPLGRLTVVVVAPWAPYCPLWLRMLLWEPLRWAFWSAFTAFRHSMGSDFPNFKHNSDLT